MITTFTHSSSNIQDGVGLDLAGSSTPLDSGQVLGPIYLTLNGVDGSTDISFATLNDRGVAISEGVVTLVENPSIITNGDRGERNGRLLQGLYPNPTGSGATVSILVNHDRNDVTVVVVDETGRVIEKIFDRNDVPAGTHMIWFDTESLPSGQYYISLTSEGERETIPLQVKK